MSGHPDGLNIYTFAFPGYGTPFDALCSLGGNWDPTGTLFLFRNARGQVFHNQTWDKYETGFWVPENGWIGLINMVKILRYAKPDSVTLKVKVGPTMYVQTYFGFNLTEETYALSYSSVEVANIYGTRPTKEADLCFSELIGAKFSTWDRDNDDNPTMNCAMEAGGGWWYRFCNESCNIFLPHYDPANLGPISYTRMRLGNINLRYWATDLSTMRLVIKQTLD